MMRKFIDFHHKDIVNFFGTLELSKEKQYLTLYVLRNMQLAGIFIGEMLKNEENFEVKILIDYVIPEYRDFKNSKFLFNENKQWFRKHKISKFSCMTNNKKHANYLLKLGFKQQEETFSLSLQKV